MYDVLSGVDELASIESSEVVDFRKHMHEMCERTARNRDSQVGVIVMFIMKLYAKYTGNLWNY